MTKDVPTTTEVFTMNAIEQENKLKVLVVEPERVPYVKDIDPGLSSLQAEVGGYIEAVYPFDDPVAIILDEEGKLCGKPLNRGLRDEEGDLYDILAGTFLVVGLTEDDFGSLSDDLIQKYSELYKTPEAFFRIGGRIIAVPIDPAERVDNRNPAEEKPSLSSQIQSAQKRAHSQQDGLSNPPEPERQ